ncbi:MAG TPA: TIGR04002 family protein [Bacillota bacterium]|nr:TIGR04002 family protein [Bacillota bacterium]HOK68842.1 TIGR04002 family protein [Bacillota bacterium]HPP85809.1 TIGR04002 family protein [Bacillota bacterium]
MRKNTKRLAATALGAAIVCIFTAFFQLKNPSGYGYIHIGDSFIYLFACTLPMPYSLLAGAIGASLADVISGYAVYALPTFLVKALMAVGFSNRHKTLSARNILAVVWASFVLNGGYFITEVILYNIEGAMANIVPNLIQAGASFVVYIFFSVILEKTKAYNSFKEELK